MSTNKQQQQRHVCQHCGHRAYGGCGLCKSNKVFYCSESCRRLDYIMDSSGDTAKGHWASCVSADVDHFDAALYGPSKGPKLPPTEVATADYRTLFRALARVMDLYHAATSKAVVRALGKVPATGITTAKLRDIDARFRADTQGVTNKALDYLRAFRRRFMVDNKAAQSIYDFLRVVSSVNPSTAAVAAAWKDSQVAPADIFSKAIPTLLLISLGVQSYADVVAFFKRYIDESSVASLAWEDIRAFLSKRLNIDREALLALIPREAIVVAIRSMLEYDTLDDFLGSMLAYSFSDSMLSALEAGIQGMDRQGDLAKAFAPFLPMLKQLVEFISYLLGATEGSSKASYTQFKAMGLVRATEVLYQPRPDIDIKTVEQERVQLMAVLEIFLNYVETVGPNMVSQFLYSLFATLGDETKFHWFVQEFNLGASEGSAQNDTNVEFITMLGRFVMGNGGPLFGKIQQITLPLIELSLGKEIIDMLKDDGKIVYPRMGPAEVYAVLEETKMNTALGDYTLDPTYTDDFAVNRSGKEVNPGRGLVASVGQVLFARSNESPEEELIIKVIKPRGFILLAAEKAFVDSLALLEKRPSIPIEIRTIIETIRSVVIENEYRAIYDEFDFSEEASNTNRFRSLYGFTREIGGGLLSLRGSTKVICTTVSVFEKLVTRESTKGLFLPQSRAPGFSVESIIAAFETRDTESLSPSKREEIAAIRAEIKTDTLKKAMVAFVARWIGAIYVDKAHRYHADLHGGNIFCGIDQEATEELGRECFRIVPIDFGNVRQLDKKFVQETYSLTTRLIQFLFAHRKGNAKARVDSTKDLLDSILDAMGVNPSLIERRTAIEDTERLIALWSSANPDAGAELQLSMVVNMVRNYVNLFGGDPQVAYELVSLLRGFAAVFGLLTSTYRACGSGTYDTDLLYEMASTGVLSVMLGGYKNTLTLLARYGINNSATGIYKAVGWTAPVSEQEIKRELERLYPSK